jgi:hypothetical protein
MQKNQNKFDHCGSIFDMLKNDLTGQLQDAILR